ncbi:type II toxin-antitoxin system prevent-host-death family antitoxin [Pseudomonas otitidis]
MEAPCRWEELLDHVITNHDQLLIRSGTGDAVLVSAEDYDAWTERATPAQPSDDTGDAAKSRAAENQ